MAKKKVKKVVARSTKSSSVRKTNSGNLFSDHPHLSWLLPLLLIAFALVLYIQNSSY